MQTQLEKALRASRMCGLNSYIRGGVRYSIDGDNILAEWSGDTDAVDIEILEGVTHIAPYAFSHLTINAYSIKFPSSFKIIPHHICSGCSALKQATFSEGLEEIGPYAFADTSIESIIIPPSVQRIGYAAFFNCSNLKEVHLSEGLVKIDEEAFGATALRKVILPSTVRGTCREAFNLGVELWTEAQMKLHSERMAAMLNSEI